MNVIVYETLTTYQTVNVLLLEHTNQQNLASCYTDDGVGVTNTKMEYTLRKLKNENNLVAFLKTTGKHMPRGQTWNANLAQCLEATCERPNMERQRCQHV